jgi:MFS family permease
MSSFAATFTALRHRNFRLLWISLLVSNSGTWLQSVAQDYVVYKLTGRALDLGLVNIVRAVPLILLAFVGGTIADRVDRRRMLLFTQTAFAVLAVVLGVLVQTQLVRVWHVVLLSFLGAVLLAFDQPARQSLLPALVPKEDLANAIALNSVTYTGAAAIGPALAGPLVAVVGLPAAFYLNAFSFSAVLFAVGAMRLPASRKPQNTDKEPESVAAAIASGIRYVAASPALVLLVGLLIAFSFFAAPYQSLLPVFNGRLFGGSVQSLGWLRAAPGVGALIGGIYLAQGAQSSDKKRLIIVGGLGFCATILLFSWCGLLPLALIALFGAGAFSTVFTSTVQTLLQRIADDQMRGRVMSLFTICVLGMWPLGSLPLAWASDKIGVQAAVSGGAAAAALLITAALWFARRTVSQLPR